MIYSLYFCIAYILGILWGLNLSKVGLIPIFLCVLVYMLIQFLKLNNNESINSKCIILNNNTLLILIILILLGLSNTVLRLYIFNSKYDDEVNSFKGEILRCVDKRGYSTKYLLKLFNGDKVLVYINKEIKLEENQVISFSGEFKKPKGARNKGGFDYAKYLYSQNIYGTIFVNGNVDILGSKFDLINTIRNSVIDILGSLLPKEQFGVLLGMIIGDTYYIDDNITESFKLSGITHLLAVSGTNISYVIIATKFIFDKLFGKKISSILSIISIILFVLISGASPSVVRAAIMAIIVILSLYFSRSPDIISSICITIIIILAFNPLIICDVGFILSFGGTIGIVLFQSEISKLLKEKFKNLASYNLISSLIDSASVTISAQIILFPFMWFYFNQISFVSILTNILVAPFIGFISILGPILYVIGLLFFPLANILSYSIYILISLVIIIANICSKVPYGNINVITPSVEIILIYYLFLILFYKKIKNNDESKSFIYKVIRLIIIALISLFLLKLIIPKDYYEFNFVDIGQGDSIHIVTPKGLNILIDGGGSENSDYDVGEKVLVPYLYDNSSGCIDTIIISHFHEDHAEGIITVLNTFKVDKLIIGPQPSKSYLLDKILSICKEKMIQVITVRSGEHFIIDGLSFDVLYPSNKIGINDFNNNSLILKATAFDTSILFTGDAELLEEQALINIYKNKIESDILKVGHHGSKTSSCEEFIDLVSPSISIISCGIDNKFGHPHQSTLNTLINHNSLIYRTDKSGEITIKIFKNKKVSVNTLIKSNS